ncbi:MFS transporter (macronuclear) [Tetrahymena thermophila SB210]|uniref:MFS transporter n=1 Tax=Tetrahymena thermophila (strain SB210) TaxID=312017 RepID=Q23AH4_TETTS|nr:MFS transporter [Tetrahymena thermophila SB210]EAR93518.2 MFS transporter [Tetrahymena thermophila SB210]|eukprot:XP_001013763.2 MFS transporter [Tetrahymena thermophila SB210]
MQQVQYKSFIRLLAIVQNASWGGFIIGYTTSELAFSYKNIIASFNNSEHEDLFNLLFVIILPLGGIVGTIIYYYISQLTSRRNILIISDIINILAIFIGYNQIYTFMLLRFFEGISNALNFCGVLLYIREIMPDQQADKGVLIFQINLNIGIIMANVLCLPLASPGSENSNQQNLNYYWRVIFVFPILICFLRMYCLIFVYDFETPYYYYSMNQQHKVNRLLKLLYDHKFVGQIQNKLEQIGQEEETSSPTYNLRKYFCSILVSIQQMTGINVGIYSAQALIDIFSNQDQLRVITLFCNILLLISAVISYIFEQQINRKTKFIGLNLLFLFLIKMVDILQNQKNSYISLICYFLFNSIFNFNVGPLILSITSDLNKEKGIAISYIFYWVFNLTSVLVGQIKPFTVGQIIFAVVCLIGFVLLYFKGIETKAVPYHMIKSQEFLKQQQN